MSDFQEGSTAAKELQPVLPSKGVPLFDEESQENAVDAARDGEWLIMLTFLINLDSISSYYQFQSNFSQFGMGQKMAILENIQNNRYKNGTKQKEICGSSDLEDWLGRGTRFTGQDWYGWALYHYLQLCLQGGMDG